MKGEDTMTNKSQTEVVQGICYCYELQAWIEDGTVAECFHRDPLPGCAACDIAGQYHGACKSCH